MANRSPSNECGCVTSDLDLWSMPPIQTGIESAADVEHRPTTSIEGQEIIEFFIPGSGEEYTDLTNSYLQVRLKIVKADGTAILADTKVAPINNTLHSVFSQVDIVLNDVLVTPSNNLYGYKAYFEDLLSHGYEAEASYLTAAMFHKETPGHLENTTAVNNGSFTWRKQRAAGSKIMEIEGRIHTELCHQPKPLLNGVDIRVKLIKSSDAFAIMKDSEDATSYKVVITDASLTVRRLKLSSELQLAHARELEKKPAVYPIKRVQMKAATIHNGGRDYRNENFFNGQLPNRIFFAFVENDSFNGDQKKNPYKFDHHKCVYLALYLDGKQIPSIPLTPDFPNEKYTRSYMKMIEATGTMHTPYGCNIEYGDYDGGYTIFGFDLSPDLSRETVTRKSGKLQIDVKFEANLTTQLTLVAYGEYDNNLYIDKNRNILFDYTS